MAPTMVAAASAMKTVGLMSGPARMAREPLPYAKSKQPISVVIVFIETPSGTASSSVLSSLLPKIISP